MSSSHNTYWAPGKLLLFGEHSAVFGYPAVGTALNRGLHVSVSPAPRMTLTLGGEAAAAKSDTEAALHRFGAFLSQRAPHLPPSRVEIVSDLPISSGFGSSAALCTALAQWSLQVEAPGTGGEPARWEMWRRAHELETFFHGTPSGIDTGLAALGGVQAFRFGPDRNTELPSATPLPRGVPHLVVGSIPRGRSTRELVEMVRQRHEEEPVATGRILADLGSLAKDAIRWLSTTGAPAAALGEMATAAHGHLSRLGISSKTMDQILHAGSSAGALGGKLSGAGDGGAFYLVCSDSDTAGAVQAVISPKLPPGAVTFRV
ncbi:MAG: mevalonate kinase [Alkalispirochaeta sp.]